MTAENETYWDRVQRIQRDQNVSAATVMRVARAEIRFIEIRNRKMAIREARS